MGVEESLIGRLFVDSSSDCISVFPPLRQHAQRGYKQPQVQPGNRKQEAGNRCSPTYAGPDERGFLSLIVSRHQMVFFRGWEWRLQFLAPETM